MTDPIAHQSDLQCTNCGGQCRFAPSEGALVCDSCGTPRRLDTLDDNDARKEFDYRANYPKPDVAEPSEVKVHQCDTCGGQVLFTGPVLSERCPYCDGPAVLAEEADSFETMALVPFAVTKDRAEVRAGAWVGQRRAAPNDLADAVGEGRIAGLYAPFWTFDSQEAVEYWAQYTTGSGDNRRTHNTSGKMKINFDDLLVPASPHVTPLIRDGILHEFRPYSLRPYIAGYLAGFAAERHHQTIEEGLQANEKDKKLLIRNRIRRHINKRGVRNIRFSTDTSGIRYRRILLPVWILHYSHKGTPKKVVVSGIDGRTFGERPFSNWKLMGYSALATAIAMFLGLSWGAMGIL